MPGQQYWISLATDTNSVDLGVPYVGDLLYSSFDVNLTSGYWIGCNAETASNYATIPKGDGNEGAVCRALWDMLDGSTTSGYTYESFDQLSLGHQSMWNLITDNAPITFSEFMSCFYSQYPISSVTGRNVGGILGTYGFTATSLTRSGPDATGGCIYFWTKPLEVDGIPYTYHLEFYGASMNLIRSIDVTSSSQPYTLSPSVWSSLFGSAQGKLYICIKVTSEQLYRTGPYYSAFITYPT